ncbi:MAG: ArsR family transcriptional regulator [Gammaproteobacteria bacterium]|nr:ArsR family transcriptional regulator [Gammaproteobacteria bacterium]NBT45014.1 ArsR family transcriptional regulator [Gammaproteobacteria bacterium]NBY22601.1 ArsR family transcriptional regulator [Gammaproteobacteria bacterium]
METNEILVALTAIAQSSRLAVFRFLVQAGEEGRPAGKIAEALDIPPSSLSFHLKELYSAGLILQRQDGRSLIYSANYARMNAVISYLTENCCNGQSC